MGYSISLVESCCFIPKKKIQEAVQVLRTFQESGRSLQWERGEEWHTLKEALRNYRWGSTSHEGNLYVTEFLGQSLGQDDKLFRLLAPFMQDNTYLLMLGEDGEVWKWVFKRGEMHEIRPIWPEVE